VLYLLKSDPETYAFGDLLRDGETNWDGVRNVQASRVLAAIRPGDGLLIYHSNTDKAVVGLAQAVGMPEPDPGDPTGKFVQVRIRVLRALDRPVTLGEFKADWPEFALVRQSRLSCMAIPETMTCWLADRGVAFPD
jgi:predicted RNA-binding protein with PUA-like domain